MPTTDIDPVRLRDLLLQAFNLDELKDLCFELDIDYDDLSGENRSAKARELVARCRRTGRLEDLLAAAERARPKLDWRGVTASQSEAAGTRAALLELQSLLGESKRALNEQKRLRSDLARTLQANRPAETLDFDGQDDLFSQLYPAMSRAERDRFEDVRNSTAAIHDVNVRILDWVASHPIASLYLQPTPAGERLAREVEALKSHLNFWMRRYERVFEKDETRALVFMADEKRRGPGWPFGLEPAVRAAIRELQGAEQSPPSADH